MTVPSKEVSWGIIRYAPGSGDFPEDDAASLDGWYTNREDALAVAKDRVSRHPQWVVGPVRSAVLVRTRRFSSFRDYPITTREKTLTGSAKEMN
jgi:hypothetical protein